MRTSTGHHRLGVEMSSKNGQISRNDAEGGNGQADMFCRSVVAALAAVLALRLCQYFVRWFRNTGL